MKQTIVILLSFLVVIGCVREEKNSEPARSNVKKQPVITMGLSEAFTKFENMFGNKLGKIETEPFKVIRDQASKIETRYFKVNRIAYSTRSEPLPPSVVLFFVDETDSSVIEGIIFDNTAVQVDDSYHMVGGRIDMSLFSSKYPVGSLEYAGEPDAIKYVDYRGDDSPGDVTACYPSCFVAAYHEAKKACLRDAVCDMLCDWIPCHFGWALDANKKCMRLCRVLG
jgi:hypothetical protein